MLGEEVQAKKGPERLSTVKKKKKKKRKKKKGLLLGLREFTSWIKRKWDFMEKDQHKQSLEA